MNSDLSNLSERLLPWAQQNWEILVAILAILVVAIYIRRALSGGASRPRPAPAAALREKPDTQALDVSVAAAAEITSDIEAYARALFTEDMTTLANRAAANAPQSLRMTTIAEAPFIYDGVIMRDLTLMPTPLIASVSGHFRQGQTILDALRRQASLTPPEATAEERINALKTVATELATGLDKATHAIEKLDAWIARNGGASDGARALADLPVAALRGAAVDRLSQRSKTYRTLREQAQARIAEINGLIDTARRAGGSGPRVDMTMVALKPDDRRLAMAEEPVELKPEDKRAAE